MFLPNFSSFGRASSFRDDFFRNQPIRNKNGFWRPCLLTNRNEMSNLYRGLPQILPTKFRFIWPSDFRGEDLKKSANQNQELPLAAMFVNGSGQNEQTLQRAFHKCFLPNFSSFWESGFRVEDFLEINQSKTKMASGRHVCQQIGTKCGIFIEDLPRMFPTKF